MRVAVQSREWPTSKIKEVNVLLRLNFRTLLMGLMVIIIVYLQYRLWAAEGGLGNLASVKTQIEQRSKENAALLERNQSLQEEVMSLRTGTTVIEQRARSELGMIKENETFYLIVDEKKDKEGK